MDAFLNQLDRLKPAEKPKELPISIDTDVIPPWNDDSDIYSDETDGEVGATTVEDWLDESLAHMHGDIGGEDHRVLRDTVLNILKSDESAESIQIHLVDAIGLDNLDIVATLLERREEILKSSKRSQRIGIAGDERARIQSENQKRLEELNSRLKLAVVDPKYPHVYRKGDGGSTMNMMGNKFTLPVGTETEYFATFEQVTIPAPVPDTSFHPKHLVRKSELDELCQVTFSQYTSLNKMQSLVYPIAYHTNENMLVCAPTGAGKTDVALLVMLATIRRHSILEGGIYRVDKDAFKIVYVAPLKALAAEIVEKVGSRLSWLGVRVRELTGDMQLTRRELSETQIIVTTPEKWDVITRKPMDDDSITTKLKLLIIDEVHLLHEDRGAVLESIVARTLRQTEASQSMIRIVGLSATLPNFIDVANFLKVNPQQGLFFFDSSFRPVPLKQIFLGVAGKAGSREAAENTDKVAFDKVVENLELGLQVMVFVHSRNDTTKTAQTFRTLAQRENLLYLFEAENKDTFEREVGGLKNRDMRDLYQQGFGIHHAGLMRSERNLSEKLFKAGAIRVLCCTATLAWGVNLPAAVVIVKGTQVYDAKKGGFTDLGVSDIIQIFGRAGRPQYESVGTGILCTSKDKMSHYLSAITNQFPIESRMSAKLADNLNAEISLGTVSNVNEAVEWLGYTYMFVRMRKAPLKYGITMQDLEDDPNLGQHRKKLIIAAAHRLQEIQMIVFDETTGTFVSKDLGRIASDFYLLNTTVEIFNEKVTSNGNENTILSMIGECGEFTQLKSRKEELEELQNIAEQAHYPISQEVESPVGKTNALIQAYVSGIMVKDSSLSSDLFYVSQNVTRLVRAFFLICQARGWGRMAYVLLSLDKSMNRRMWSDENPMKQFELPQTVMRQLESRNLPIEEMKAMSATELGDLVHNHGMGPRLFKMLSKFPLITITEGVIHPITSKVVRVEAVLLPSFQWDPMYHGSSESFWIWIMDDSETATLLHTERLVVNKGAVNETKQISFAIPIQDPPPRQLIIRAISDSWIGSEAVFPIQCSTMIKPQTHPIRTELLNLRPLPVSALKNPLVEAWYLKKFSFFNPMQTMCFHTLYHKNTSVLLGSPTGSGKTIACEIALWAALRDRPGSKIVYIAPMKALVKERVNDWKNGLAKATHLKLVELTGDSNPSLGSVQSADIIVTTPEKFDGISRSWQTRSFVQKVSLIIMDEVHLLASDRGAVLEMIVSRMNFVEGKTGNNVRLMGMSTAVANAGDLASWLGVKSNAGLFNFPSSVRPVPLEMYIDGFADNVGFCPLMKSMNKPVFTAIKSHSPTKPVLVFVPSRRQTRLTAQDLINFCAQEDNPRRFSHMDEDELQNVLDKVKDETLRLSLQFGIAIHHAGLIDSDRALSHELFAKNKVQILVATSTLAWGVNLPAYLVVVKGTQFYDSKLGGYKDMDLTDVLQMMGRAGRPAFDTSGVARVFTKQSTKSFYKYFLNIGFPVESSLHKFLEDHIGAEIAAGTIKTRQAILDFLTWTFLYRRVHENPTYYEIENVNDWLNERVKLCLDRLEDASCITRGEELKPTPFLKTASFYYLSHKTIKMFLGRAKPEMTVPDILSCLALASEYDELAIRHNEDVVNEEISQDIPYHGNTLGLRMVDPHVKVFVLIQARMLRRELPIEDYAQDTVTVMDQAIRIMQALIDVLAELKYFSSVVRAIELMRCIKQACPPGDNMLRVFPGLWKTKSTRSIMSIGPNDANSLHVPRAKQSQFRQAFTKVPKLQVVGGTISLRPSGSVYCPHYNKPQPESWFVIHELGGSLTSLQRVQRPLTLSTPEKGSLLVLNDTLDLHYALTTENSFTLDSE